MVLISSLKTTAIVSNKLKLHCKKTKSLVLKRNTELRIELRILYLLEKHSYYWATQPQTQFICIVFICSYSQRPEWVSDSLELELHAVVSCLMVVLEIKLRSSGTAVFAFKWWAISSTHPVFNQFKLWK